MATHRAGLSCRLHIPNVASSVLQPFWAAESTMRQQAVIADRDAHHPEDKMPQNRQYQAGPSKQISECPRQERVATRRDGPPITPPTYSHMIRMGSVSSGAGHPLRIESPVARSIPARPVARELKCGCVHSRYPSLQDIVSRLILAREGRIQSSEKSRPCAGALRSAFGEQSGGNFKIKPRVNRLLLLFVGLFDLLLLLQ